jgi:hypothetical protein
VTSAQEALNHLYSSTSEGLFARPHFLRSRFSHKWLGVTFPEVEVVRIERNAPNPRTAYGPGGLRSPWAGLVSRKKKTLFGFSLRVLLIRL